MATYGLVVLVAHGLYGSGVAQGKQWLSWTVAAVVRDCVGQTSYTVMIETSYRTV